MKKVVGLILGLLPISVSAECVPVPDCASIGYTETSCDGDSLKCPFDTSKLYCPPCDSSYKYSCTGDNIKNPIGDTCNNKYAACECVGGAAFSNGQCICNSFCEKVGNIYYSDGTCSSCNHSDKIPVGIIVNYDEAKYTIMNLSHPKMTWSADQKDEGGNVVLTFHLDMTCKDYDDEQQALSGQFCDGKEQTQGVVDTYGSEAVAVAAIHCYNYEPNNFADSKGQWYLPSMKELYYDIYKNITQINNSFFVLENDNSISGTYWSSSEWGTYGYYAWCLKNGSLAKIRKETTNIGVVCFLSIAKS